MVYLVKDEDDDAVTWTRDHAGWRWLGQYYVPQMKYLSLGQEAADSDICFSIAPNMTNMIEITCTLQMTITTTLIDVRNAYLI